MYFPAGGGAEQHDPLRIRRLDDAAHDLSNEAFERQAGDVGGGRATLAV